MLNSKLIEKLREDRDFSQSSFAEAIDISLNTYLNQLKTGNFRSDQVMKMAKLLKVSIHILFADFDIIKEKDHELTEEETSDLKIIELKKEIKALKKKLEKCEFEIKSYKEIIEMMDNK